MIDPTITCPACKTEIKLTESLAAPLIESTRKQYELRLSEKDAEISNREAAVKSQQIELAKARAGIEAEVTEKVKSERVTIAAEEAKKARLLLTVDLDTKSKEITDLKEVLAEREKKLAEAQMPRRS